MKKLTRLKLVSAALCSFALTHVSCTPAVGSERSNLTCDVAIIGGGAGGLHTAFRLGPTLGQKVCLFEKEARIGGRIYDVSKEPGGPNIGVGARRIMEGQKLVFALADELGIEYVEAPWQDDLINARGTFGLKSDELRSAYPALASDQTEETLYNKLRSGPERANIKNYPDFRSYVRAALGEQAYHFLLDMSRFRADFEYTLSAQGYLEYLDEEWDVCCKASYPVGGMSEFIRRMEAKALASGVRIYKGEPVNEMARNQSYTYTLLTPKYKVTAKQLVIAADAEGLKKIQGPLAEAIKIQPQFQDLVGVRVVTITQWWPKAWWLDSKAHGTSIKRAWTSDHCLNHIEIPVDPYGVNQVVTRSVYDDDMRCVQFWENTAKLSTELVEAEIARGLKSLFPDVEIPKPDKTFVHVWPAAWYWLKGGSQFTNADIAKWAVDPLPGEKVSLVSESYYPQRSGWSDGAYKSSINTLNAKFGMKLEMHQAKVQFRTRPSHARRSLSQGGH
jgi:glycine/D-amino acid oxidase-like deaminating enzyme